MISLSNIMLRFDERIPTSEGFETLHHVGMELGDPERAFPRFKSTLILGWAMGDWSASLTGRYIHGVKESCVLDLYSELPETCSNIDPNDPSKSRNNLDPTVYLDAQVTWIPSVLDEDLFITLGVNNILNQEPPYCYSCALNGFDASTYDTPGLFGYVRCGYRM